MRLGPTPEDGPGTLRRTMRLLDDASKRRMKRAVGLAVIQGGVEAAAFYVLFAVITSVTSASATPPSWAEEILGSADRSAFIVRGASLAFGLLVLKTICNVLVARVQAAMHSGADEALATRAFRRILQQPLLEHVGRNSADRVNVLTWAVPDLAANVLGASVGALADVLSLAAVVVAVAIASPMVAIGVVSFAALLVTGLLVIINPLVRRIGHDENASNARSLRHMQDGLTGIKVWLATDSSDAVAASYAESRRDLARVRRKKVLISRLPGIYLEAMMTLGLGLGCVIAFSTSSDERALATLGLIVAACFRGLPMVVRLVAAVNGLRGAQRSLEHVEEELRRPVEALQPGPPIPLRTDLALDGVSFSYPATATAALAEVSIAIPAGTSLGLVGGSGAGKTTLVDVVLGLLEPSAGRLLVDGVPITPDLRGRWRRSIGYVPQEVFLLDASLRDNVLFGRDHDGDDALIRALAEAQLAEFVALLPEGLDTRLGERGARLSGGQRQRVGIARALYASPSLLILDEATSALDGRTEAAFTDTVRSLSGSITQIVVAHRLTTVRACDRIAYLHDGKLLAAGTFEALQREVREFDELVRLGQLSA